MFPFYTYMFCIVFLKEFLSFPLLVETVIRIPKTVYYLQSNKTSNLQYHLTEQKKKHTKLSQTALKLSNTHTTFMHKPSTPSFSANLCRVYAFFSHLFRSYLFLSCLRILAFRHSLWFITIVQTPGGLFQNFAHLNAVCPLFYRNARLT